MEEKKMQELNMDEIEQVSGGVWEHAFEILGYRECQHCGGEIVCCGGLGGRYVFKCKGCGKRFVVL